MNNTRFIQLIKMFSYIGNKTPDEAEDIILMTETGRAIQKRVDSTLFYEQQTENLFSIVTELRQIEYDAELTERFTIEAIVNSLDSIDDNEGLIESATAPKAKNPELKRLNTEILKERQRQKLIEKRQNYLNVRRTEYADKFKGKE